MVFHIPNFVTIYYEFSKKNMSQIKTNCDIYATIIQSLIVTNFDIISVAGCDGSVNIIW